MYTPPANHRYRGPRESAKLVAQNTGSVSDMTKLTELTASISLNYDAAIPDHFTGIDGDYQSAVQRARLVAEFARRVS